MQFIPLNESSENCLTNFNLISKSENIFSYESTLSMINCENSLKEKLYATICIKNWIQSTNDNFLIENVVEIRNRLIGKIIEMNRYSINYPMSIPVITKLYECLIWLYFKTSKLWTHPLKWIMLGLINGDSSFNTTDLLSVSDETVEECLVNSIHTEQINENILLLLSLISEEFTLSLSSLKLSHSIKCNITEGIHSDELLVKNILKRLISDVHRETICTQAIHTCGLWISNFVTSNSAAINYLDLIHTVYASMHHSEHLYLAGVNCLIAIFESDGSGLNSDRDTAFLLDFHISELIQFKSALQHLVELHSVDVQKHTPWNEFKGYEALSKTALLLSILSDKQMDYLIHRLDRSRHKLGDSNENIHEFFDMLLLTFSLTGHYPYNEDVSDIGLQIWLNMHEASITTTTSNTITATTVTCSSNSVDYPDQDVKSCDDVVKRIHAAFNQCAFIKSHYPNDINQYLSIWNVDDRSRWLKFRQDLAESFLTTFRYMNLNDWFLYTPNQLDQIVNNCTNEEFMSNWQVIEVLVFILSSISEDVLYENASGIIPFIDFAQSISNCLLKIVNRIQQMIIINIINSNYNIIQWEAQRLLSTTIYPQLVILFQTLLSCIQRYYIHISCHNNDELLTHFVLNSLLSTIHRSDDIDDKYYTDEMIVLRHCSLQLLQTILEHKSFSSNLLVNTITSGVVYFLNHSISIDPTSNSLLFYCIGILFYLIDDKSTLDSLEHILYNQLTIFEVLCTEQDSSKFPQDITSMLYQLTNERLEIKNTSYFITILLKNFIQIYRGYVSIEQLNKNKPIKLQSISMLSKLFSYLKQSLPDASFYQLPDHFGQYHEFLRVSLRFFTCILQYTTNNEMMICIMNECINSSILSIFNNLLNNSYQLNNDDFFKSIQYFIEWLLFSYYSDQVDKTFSIVYLSIGLNLLSDIFNKISNFLIQQAKRIVFDRKDECINHPISPILMNSTTQSITEMIEASTRFIHNIIHFKLHGRIDKRFQYETIYDVLQLYFNNDNIYMKISLSLAFSGIGVDDDSTVESCLRLACDLITIINNKRDLLINDKLLYEINVCILLVFIKRNIYISQRIIRKYAELYLLLANLPSRQQQQYNLLYSILISTTTTTDKEFYPTIIQSIHYNTNEAERLQFITTITQSSLSINKLCNCITRFIQKIIS
ncbi:unnamed protein product [Heterobilharzia americana]|nr:unnamed protein product [Heterobilharzia americana]